MATTKKIEFAPIIMPRLRELVSSYQNKNGFLVILGSGQKVSGVIDITKDIGIYKTTYEPNQLIKLWEHEDYLGLLLISQTSAADLNQEEKDLFAACGEISNKKGKDGCCAKICTRCPENVVDDSWKIAAYTLKNRKNIEKVDILISSEEFFDA